VFKGAVVLDDQGGEEIRVECQIEYDVALLAFMKLSDAEKAEEAFRDRSGNHNT